MRSGERGQERYEPEEESTDKSYLAENLLDVVSSRLTLSDTGDCAALPLKVICNLIRVEGYLRIEVCEGYYKCEERNGIEHAARREYLRDDAPAALRALGYTRELKDCGNERDYRARKYDRHNAGHIELYRKVRALTAVHLASDDLLCVLDRYSSFGAGDPYNEHEQRHNRHDKYYREESGKDTVKHGAVVLVAVGTDNKLGKVNGEGRNRRDNVCKEYKRYTVAYAALVYSLAEPHDYRGARAVAKHNGYTVEPERAVLSRGCSLCKSIVVLKIEVVCNRGDKCQSDGNYSR